MDYRIAAAAQRGGAPHGADAMARLREYHRKRDFDVTPEPRGAAAVARDGHRFVVQKHAASRLHYDFRLELDGVLKSWAIPKGPSLDPADKRLAMQTEDHPVEYADFEGVIPQDEYGGGSVLLWDRGTWTPLEDVQKGQRRGRLVFELAGEKLRGRWSLVRLRGRGEKSWLLIKGRDAWARSPDQPPVTAARAESVASGRTIEDVAHDQDRVWRSNRPADGRTTRRRPTRRPAAASRDGAVVLAGVRLTHPDRLLYPDDGITKLGLARFYEGIADWILPHLVARPTTLVRCPEGIGGECFFQKHVGYWAPDTLRRVHIREKRKVGQYLIVDDLPGLIGLVQIGILEIHTWNARTEHLDRPDRLVFDLDPGEGVSWAAVVAAARVVRERLAAFDLASFVKTTGGRGLHVVVPIVRGPDWDACASFARSVAEGLAREAPDAFVASMSKAQRTGRIFVDYLRNTRGATSVAAYSTRARPSAPVSTPLAWDELDAGTPSDRYTVANLPRRLRMLRRDPWEAFWSVRQKLPAANRSRRELTAAQRAATR